MRHLKLFEQFISEKNKTVEFFRANRDKLPHYSTSNLPPAKNAWEPTHGNNISDTQNEKMRKLNDKFIDKLNKLPGADDEIMFKEDTWTMCQFIIGFRSGHSFSRWYSGDVFRSDIITAKSFDEFASKEYTLPDFSRRKPEDVPEIVAFMQPNWDKLVDILKWYTTAEKALKGADYLAYEKSLLKMGINPDDVKAAMTSIEHWTSMSRKRLDPSIYDLLRKISVDPGSLPKYVYRGIFYDGAKIKDRDKWLNKWKPGSKPGVKPGKATSWTIDRKTAANFMIDQDFIKNSEDGYFMLLKWEVDPQFVVADLRNLPVDHTFWNQQEIIVSTEAIDYEVDTMIPGNDRDAWRNFTKSMKGGQGPYGTSKSDYAQRFLESPYDTLGTNEKIEFKRIAKMTFGEFKNAYPKAYLSRSGGKFKDVKDADKVAFPLLAYVNEHTPYCQVTKVLSASEILLESKFSLNTFAYIRNDAFKSLYAEAINKYDANQFAGSTVIQGLWKVSMQNDAYYDIELTVILPKSLDLVDIKSSDRDTDIKANNALEYIYNKLGNDGLRKVMSELQEDIIKHLPANIKVNLK